MWLTVLWSSSLILNRPLDFNIQLVSGTEDKVWLPEELSSSKHKIRLGILALFHKRPSKKSVSDVTNGSDKKLLALGTQGLTDLACEVCLKCLVNFDLLRLQVSTAADVENINSQRGKLLGKADAALQIPRGFVVPLHPLSSRDAYPERKFLRDNSTNGFGDLKEQTSAVLKASAILIRSFL